jgi:hypothetical protein
MAIISLYDFYNKIIQPREFIIQASDTSGYDKNNSNNYSIGLSKNVFILTNKEKIFMQIGKHENLVFSSFSTHTDSFRRGGEKINRKIIHNNLLKNGIFNYKLDYERFIYCLTKYKFVISPEGNGSDCHRHYEALLCGCIPIVEYNKEIEKKYKGLPILYTKDYTEITPQYLNLVYRKMIYQKYNFSKLMFSYFSESDREEIKEKGNFWCYTLLRKKAYN